MTRKEPAVIFRKTVMRSYNKGFSILMGSKSTHYVKKTFDFCFWFRYNVIDLDIEMKIAITLSARYAPPVRRAGSERLHPFTK